MKILLIYKKTGNKPAEYFQNFLEEKKIHFEICPISDESDDSLEKQFTAFFGIPVSAAENKELTAENQDREITHVLILSSLSKRLFDFFAGYSWGSFLPCVVYGKGAIAGIPDDFPHCFRLFKTKEDLKKYLEDEKDIFKKQEAVREIQKAQEALLQMGVPVTEEAFAHCVDEGSLLKVSLFMGAGFSPDTRDKSGIPMLHIAARKGNRMMIQLLLKSGARINSLSDDRNSSALIDCTLGKHSELVDDLIKAGADLDIQSKDGQSALLIAVGIGYTEIIESLLKAGANADILDSMGMSARKYATLFRKEAIMALFAEYAPVV